MFLYCKGEKMGDKFRVKNWSEYDAGLKQRGSLTFWVNEEVLKSWLEEEKTGKQGASPKYSDQAIITMMTIKRVMGLAGRQTEGFVGSRAGKCGMDNLNVSFNKEHMHAMSVMWSSKSAQTWQDEQGEPTIYLPELSENFYRNI